MENEVVKFTRETTLELAKIQREKMLQRAIILAGNLTEKAFSEIEKSNLEVTNIGGNNGKDKQSLETIVTTILADKLNALLKDCTWRIRTAVNKEKKIPAEGLDLHKHHITGFSVTDNSPIAGKIAWESVHIVYQGVDVTIDDGNTADKYIWWDYSAEPNTLFQTSAGKPTMTDDDVLVFINESGTHHTIMSNMPPGAFLLGTSISPLELAANAVITTKILDANVTEGKLGAGSVTVTKIGALAVTEAKIGAGAVTVNKIGDLAVSEAKLAAGSVTHLKLGADAVEAGNIKDGEVGSAEIAALAIIEGKIAVGAVTVDKIGDLAVSEGKLGAGVVTVGKLGNLAVETGKINDLAVTAGKLGAGSVTHAKLGADAVEADNIKDGEVDTAELAPGAVTNVKIGNGVIATVKLNLLAHMIY